MMLKRNKIMLMPPSIGFLNRGKTKYIKIYKGTEMKCAKMTALYARSMQQNHGLFDFSPKLACNVCTYVCYETSQ